MFTKYIPVFCPPGQCRYKALFKFVPDKFVFGDFLCVLWAEP